MEKQIEDLIKEETEHRLQEMSSPTYVFPERVNKIDFVGIIAGALVCLILIILCMAGVIA